MCPAGDARRCDSRAMRARDVVVSLPRSGQDTRLEAAARPGHPPCSLIRACPPALRCPRPLAPPAIQTRRTTPRVRLHARDAER